MNHKENIEKAKKALQRLKENSATSAKRWEKRNEKTVEIANNKLHWEVTSIKEFWEKVELLPMDEQVKVLLLVSDILLEDD